MATMIAPAGAYAKDSCKLVKTAEEAIPLGTGLLKGSTPQQVVLADSDDIPDYIALEEAESGAPITVSPFTTDKIFFVKTSAATIAEGDQLMIDDDGEWAVDTETGARVVAFEAIEAGTGVGALVKCFCLGKQIYTAS